MNSNEQRKKEERSKEKKQSRPGEGTNTSSQQPRTEGGIWGRSFGERRRWDGGLAAHGGTIKSQELIVLNFWQ